MNNVPLIQGNSTQEINTSIIALKKAAKELEDLNTLVNKKLAEVNEALSKEIDNVNTSLSSDITDLQNTISALDLSQVGGSGYYIESLSQTDGKVSAIPQAIADTVTSGNAHSVSSSAVYNYLRGGDLRFSWLKLNPSNVNFSYIIPQNSVHRVDDVENKTVSITIKLYRYANNYNIQISYGNTDPYMQQMSGVGRTWFEEITGNTNPDGQDGVFKYYTRRISVPQGNNYLGIGTTVNIGVYDLHFE